MHRYVMKIAKNRIASSHLRFVLPSIDPRQSALVRTFSFRPKESGVGSVLC